MISIIIPIYNSEKYLEKSVRSVLAQTYTDIEIILINDGSTDGSGGICDMLATEDCRVKAVHKQNGGVASARNVGVAAARGDYIGFADSDDYLEPDMFEYLITSASKYNADIVQCGYVKEYPNSRLEYNPVKSITELDTLAALDEIFRYRKLCNSLVNKLIKRSLFEGIVFPEGKVYEDLATMWKIIQKAGKTLCLPGIKYHYIQYDNSISNVSRLQNACDMWDALAERRLFVEANMPSAEIPVALSCVNAIWKTWIAYGSDTKAEREKYSPHIKDMTEYSKAAIKKYRSKLPLGAVSKMIITSHASAFTFGFARLCRLVHRLTHKNHT